MNSLNAISPIDGRYSYLTAKLNNYFSESSLIKYRINVEINYFLELCKIIPSLKKISKSKKKEIELISKKISINDIKKVKTIESKINHDVKAVEYFIKDKFIKIGLIKYIEYIHFGLTSQDINNTATPLLLKDSLENVFYIELEKIIAKLQKISSDWSRVSMLAKTHGQPASPTKMGKEIAVFKNRIQIQYNQLKKIPHSAKFGGATGNLNAHYVAHPEIDWHKFSKKFIESMGMKRSYPTTQIEHYDNLASQLDAIKRINTIFIDLSRDIWLYISMEYFKQKVKKNEVGSSAMPHKVNPIDFENAEGNLGLANSIFTHLSEKLPISRLQRDLSDSTVLRNLGVPISHSLIAYKSLLKGLEKIIINKEKITEDLENNWLVISEAIQTILRREGFKNPYELMKDLTRGKQKIKENEIINFIQSLPVSEKIKKELLRINPKNYTGKI